jgi:hypothetical protein
VPLPDGAQRLIDVGGGHGRYAAAFCRAAGSSGRVSTALNPGGRIVLLEQFAGPAPGPAVYAINRLLDLTYHLVLKGRTYRFADAAGWLTDAAFGTPKRINLRSAAGASLATATKPRNG